MGLSATKPVENQWSGPPPAEPSKHYEAFYESLPFMTGKTVVITGCTTGVGLISAQVCAELGARVVVMLNRSSERAEQALKAVQKVAAQGTTVRLVPCDLTNFDSVRQCGETLRCDFRDDGIDVLCNNAGVTSCPDEATVNGCDIQMQTNHLSHFLLTKTLWPLLERAAEKRGEARVVNHTSIEARRAESLLVEYLGKNGGNLGGDWGAASNVRYQQSKLANVVYTSALHERLQQSGSRVKSLCAHPGIATTHALSKVASQGNVMGLVVQCLMCTVAQSAEDGSMGILHCCCDPTAQSGELYGPPGRGFGGRPVLLPEDWVHVDKAARTLLWEESSKTTATEFLVGGGVSEPHPRPHLLGHASQSALPTPTKGPA